MPQGYKHIYNGNALVLRKIKTPTAVKLKVAAHVTPAVEGIQAVAPAKTLDAKAMRAKLTAELFRSL